MKITVIGDIAPNSTRDCGDGLVAGFRSLGHEVDHYPTWAYYSHMIQPYGEDDLTKIPREALAAVNGAIGQMILGATMLNAPDWVIVVSGWIMPRPVLEAIKAQGIGAALYMTESPYQDAEQVVHESLGGYDVVFCNDRASVPIIGEHHQNVVYLPHSFNPDVHRSEACEQQLEFDVFMCGSGFSERQKLIKAANWGDIRVHLIGFWPGEGMPPQVTVTNGTLLNSSLPAIYHAAPININIHRTTKTWKGGGPDEEHIEYAESIGPRVYEVLACGGFLMTDHRAELADAGLRDGEELVVFADAHDLGDKARWYLQHPDERKRIAANGRAAIQRCTFSSRAQQIILPALSKKG